MVQLGPLDIHYPEFQDLTHPHAAPGHEFQNQTGPDILGPKDHFIHNIFGKGVPLWYTGISEKFSKDRGVTWIGEAMVGCFSDEIEKARTWPKRFFLVDAFLPSTSGVRNARISSVVIDSASLGPNCLSSLTKVYL